MTSLNNTSVVSGTSEDYGVIQYQETLPLRIFRHTLFTLIILASLIGNSVVCKAIWRAPHRKPFSYHLVANMAFAEIVNSLCLPIMYVWQYEKGHKNVVIHDIWCVDNPIQVISLMVVTFSLAALAFYRYRVLINPIQRHVSGKLKTVIFSCLWLVPTAVCVPIFIRNRFVGGHCELHPVGNVYAYSLVLFTLNYVLPYLVMLASYGAVAWNLRQRIGQNTSYARSNSIIPSSVAPLELHTNYRRRETTTPEEHRPGLVLIDVNNRRCTKPENTTDAEQDLLKMIFAIILIFVICYFPYQAVFLWETLADVNEWKFRYHSLMRRYSFVLICLPSALHPVCYGTMNSFYAKAFSKIFLCKS